MLKSTLAIAAALFTSLSANAAGFTCTGAVLDYVFNVTGSISGGRAIGSTHVLVTKAGQPLVNENAPVTSSSFVAGHSFNVTIEGPHGRMAVTSTFAGGNTYNGTMAIYTNQGNTSVGTSCRIQ
jgi:hypothetical protein